MSESMIFAADPSVVRFILRDGELAGFMGAFPNLGRGIRKAGGELLPFGWYPHPAGEGPLRGPRPERPGDPPEVPEVRRRRHPVLGAGAA
ncbi:MAG: hypothetical protein M0C28_30060 [Candidatus Moduliflexus flocculans]|nr:hypothetical protein [Candidatus Moduliflexus flocculans]